MTEIMTSDTARAQDPGQHRWMTRVLTWAGIYNLVWGAAVIFFPLLAFRIAGMDEPKYPQIWQCVGMVVGVYGIGYLIAARHPLVHWPIVLVGWLGKIFGPLGFLGAAVTGTMPWSWGWIILFNDVIWWIPFTMILYQAVRYHSDRSTPANRLDLATAMSSLRSHRGATLEQLSARMPTLVVFVRHAGCVFCREALSDVADAREHLEQEGIQLAVVHMSEPLDATMLLGKYGLQAVHRFSDPGCQLHEAFRIERGTLRQLFGWSSWKRVVPALLKGHGLGALRGDGFRLGAAFLLDHGTIVWEQRLNTAAERLAFCQLSPPGPAPVEQDMISAN